ncbi:hypothetical protein RRG08_018383 [Elysia crispata]|uniref:Uncharacterized protein n=1 Tax=Elysia crispata TaxID=231223 RepID=A0AAE0YNE5_9GAST|nr:hypothetical protein RRG08_018383 [Elysia crispata]
MTGVNAGAMEGEMKAQVRRTAREIIRSPQFTPNINLRVMKSLTPVYPEHQPQSDEILNTSLPRTPTSE